MSLGATQANQHEDTDCFTEGSEATDQCTSCEI